MGRMDMGIDGVAFDSIYYIVQRRVIVYLLL